MNMHGLQYKFIPHAVEVSPEKQNARNRHNLPQEGPLLALVANFWPVKNHVGLLKTLQAIPELKFTLAICGKNHNKEYQQLVYSLARKDPRVIMLGEIPHDQACSLIRDADILLVPSLAESAGPLVVLQAMALGTPWIATPTCNCVQDQAGGIISSVENFPLAIQSLLENVAFAKVLGQLGNEHWARCLSWPPVISAFINLIENKPKINNLHMPNDIREKQFHVSKKINTYMKSITINSNRLVN